MSDVVKNHVKAYISSFANIPISDIKDENVLTEHPLNLDSTKLLFLAMSLRGYIKSKKPQNTIRVSEVRKNQLTVHALYLIVLSRIS